ncbi:MAG: M16 family metallopeptidase [Helicobacteraceae bacterium]
MKQILLALALFSYAVATPLAHDGKIVKGTLKNGLSYYIKQNATPEKTAYFSLIVSAGSMEEDQDQLGVAHLVEHMAFNGTTHFKGNALVKALEAMGVSFGYHLNAYTEYDNTVYKLEFPLQKDNLDKALLVLHDWSGGLLFDSTELDKERGVVVEEARKRDDVSFDLFMQSKDLLFENSRYKDRTPIGDMNIIKTIKRERVKAFYDDWYRPDLMTIVAVGDFDAKLVEKKIIARFGALRAKSTRQKPPRLIPNVDKTRISTSTSPELTKNAINISYIEDNAPVQTQEDYKKLLVQKMLSELVAKIYEKTAATQKTQEAVQLFSYNFKTIKTMHDFAVNVFGDDYKTALDGFSRLVQRVQKYGFSAQDYETVRQDLLKSNLENFKSAKTLESAVWGAVMTNALIAKTPILSSKDRYELTAKILRQITLDELNKEFTRITGLKNRVVIFESADKAAVPSEQAVLEALDQKLDKLENFESQRPLPSSLPVQGLRPAKILSNTYDKKRALRILRLENNATVVLKNTPQTQNSISLNAVSKGGLSLVATQDLYKAALGVEVSNASGTGDFNAYELSKILKGHKISLHRSIGKYYEEISGNAALESAEEMLKMLYLDFSAPKINDVVLENKKESYRELIAKRKNDPNFLFKEALNKFYYQNNPRTRELERAELDGFIAKEMLEILRQRFSGADDFVFIFTGKIQEKTLIPLVQKYIGNLKSSGQKEEIQDTKEYDIRGAQTFTKHLNNKNISEVALMFRNYDADFSYDTQFKLNALLSILSTRLREEIREEKSGVYGVSVGGGLSRIPYVNSNVVIKFSCAPGRASELIEETKRVVKSLTQSPVDPSYLKNYQKISLVKRQRDLKTEQFWARILKDSYVFGYPLEFVDDYEQKINALTPDDLMAVAQKYLSQDELFISVLAPKNAYDK